MSSTAASGPAKAGSHTGVVDTSGATLRGGEWLLKSSDPGSVFTPERLSEEHRLIAQTVNDFVDKEVLPVLDRLEEKDWGLARDLVRRCGDLGLLGVDAPEVYGGVQMDKVTSMVVSESISRSASFGATFGAQANLMILPLVLFGTEAQKQKYLPRLISGEIVGAYCLSEPGPPSFLEFESALLGLLRSLGGLLIQLFLRAVSFPANTVRWAEYGPAVEELAAAPWVGRLRRLTLRAGGPRLRAVLGGRLYGGDDTDAIPDAAVRALADAPDPDKLERLVLPAAAVGPSAREELTTRLGGRVVFA